MTIRERSIPVGCENLQDTWEMDRFQTMKRSGTLALTLCAALIMVLGARSSYAQDEWEEPMRFSPVPKADSTGPAPDTLGPPTPERARTAGQLGPRRSPEERQKIHRSFFQSPTGKLLRSVAFPGWGQWSNGKKQKAAVYFAIETYFLTKALIWRHRAAQRLPIWENSCTPDGGCDVQAFNDYDTARDRRNYFYYLTGATVFISMFDAYADAYLLTLERTRNEGDEYWGGHASLAPEDEWRLVATLKW